MIVVLKSVKLCVHGNIFHKEIKKKLSPFRPLALTNKQPLKQFGAARSQWASVRKCYKAIRKSCELLQRLGQSLRWWSHTVILYNPGPHLYHMTSRVRERERRGGCRKGLVCFWSALMCQGGCECFMACNILSLYPAATICPAIAH